MAKKAEELIVNPNTINVLIKLTRNRRDEGLPMVVRPYLFDVSVKHMKGKEFNISLPTLLSLVKKKKEKPIVDTKENVDDSSVIVFTPPWCICKKR